MEGLRIDKRERDHYFSIIADHYGPMIKAIIGKYIMNVGDYRIDYDELYQEGLIALYQACKSYSGADSDFEKYVYVVIRRKVWRSISFYLRRYNYETVSIDREVFNDSCNLLYRHAYKLTPSYIVKLKEYESELRLLYDGLSDMQKKIVDLRAQGQKYASIAMHLGIDKKKVDNEIQKIKRLIKKVAR